MDLRAVTPDSIPRLVAFDLDDTLAPSKSTVTGEIATLMVRLLRDTDVCVISGGRFEQFEAQLLSALPDIPYSLERLHLMPTCGTQYYRYAGRTWHRLFSEDLTGAEKREAIASLERHARRLGYWESWTWGSILEDRGSQVTFSALGQRAPISAKAGWDPGGAKKEQLRRAVQQDLPQLEVRSGGSTSIDVTRRGVDKAYGIRRLSEMLRVGLDEMMFVGDRLDPAGNDFPVVGLGVTTVAVANWQETAKFIRHILAIR